MGEDRWRERISCANTDAETLPNLALANPTCLGKLSWAWGPMTTAAASCAQAASSSSLYQPNWMLRLPCLTLTSHCFCSMPQVTPWYSLEGASTQASACIKCHLMFLWLLVIIVVMNIITVIVIITMIDITTIIVTVVTIESSLIIIVIMLSSSTSSS